MANVLDIARHQFDAIVMNSDFLVIVDFWAPWCGPCKTMGPILEAAAQYYTRNLRVYKLNVDDEPELAISFGVKSIPTMIFFENGKIVERLSGSVSSVYLGTLIEKLITKK